MDYDYYLEKNEDGMYEVFSANSCKAFSTYEEAVAYLKKVEQGIYWAGHVDEE